MENVGRRPCQLAIQKNLKIGGLVELLTRIVLGIPGVEAIHDDVPHFEVVAQVVIMLFELGKE